MALLVRESFINATTHCSYGDSGGWYEPFTDDRKRLFRDLQKEYGGCISRIYIDAPNSETKAIGWVFSRRERYEDAPRNDKSERWSYVREVWVEVREVVNDAGEIALQDQLVALA